MKKKTVKEKKEAKEKLDKKINRKVGVIYG